MNYLFIANLCVWIGIGGYLCFIHAAQKRLAERIDHMEIIHDR
ncbi:CcmD family protein [Desulfoplanes sp.]